MRGNLMMPASILPDRRVHLSLLALTRLLIMPVLAKVGEYARLLALFLEAPQRPLEVLIFADDDFRQPVPPRLDVAAPVKCNEATILCSDLN